MAQKFEFEENQNNYGVLEYKHASTLKRYRELCDERNKVNVAKYDCFFAFSNRQFEDGMKSIRPLREGEKLVSIGAGGYGTKDGAKRLFEFYDDINDKIRSECNPQEVYVYEYNNHECCIDWDGDLNAIRIIASVWGDDVARTIKRKNVFYPIDKLFEQLSLTIIQLSLRNDFFRYCFSMKSRKIYQKQGKKLAKVRPP